MTEARVCPVCGVEFNTTHHGKIYCSIECKRQMKYRKLREQRAKIRRERKPRIGKKPMEPIAMWNRCKWCGFSFLSMSLKSYCSTNCRGAGYSLGCFLKSNEKLLDQRYSSKELRFLNRKNMENMAYFFRDELEEIKNGVNPRVILDRNDRKILRRNGLINADKITPRAIQLLEELP